MESSTDCKRILGIDYGSRRVGLALSDSLALIALPIQAVKNDPSLINSLKEVLNREKVKIIVVGMPYNLRGQKAQKADEVQEFITKLKTGLNIEVVTWDERFTTTIAQKTMIAMGTKKKDRQKKDGRIDSMAAALILQGFLDSTKHSCSC
jgi:putative holliday junction resolvase